MSDESLPGALAAIVGERQVITDPAGMAPHLVEWRDIYRGHARAVVRPGSTAEVAAVMAMAHGSGVPIVPQGGNTGLVGGQIPDRDGRAIVLSMSRMTAVRSVDPAGNALTVEAGVTLAAAQAVAERAGRLFPLSLASEGSCTIGGNLATNAGGTAVLAYGNARELTLGLEVVLADGRVWNGLGALRKDNTGYDLKNLFVGSEGTLGVITAATLRLFPRPAGRATAFVGLSSPHRALALLQRLQGLGGGSLTTFELMPRTGIDYVLRHAAGARDPLPTPHRWYVLAEVSGSGDGTTEALAGALETALGADEIEDAAVAASEAQRRAFWALRELLSEVQRHEGGSIKHDVAVPVAVVPDFLDRAILAVENLVPDCRPVPFGHLGDGNIHFNVSQPVGADKAAFLSRWDEVNAVVHGIVRDMGGSISAEHGIGQLKRHLLPDFKDPVALDLMRALKRTLDPTGILNPGKVL